MILHITLRKLFQCATKKIGDFATKIILNYIYKFIESTTFFFTSMCYMSM